MAEHRTDIESYLTIDGPVLLHLAVSRRSGQRYRSIVRGWVKSRYVMIDRPRVGARYLHMERGEPCVVRFLTQGNACGFESVVLDWDTRPHISYCLVAWPAKLDLVVFRKCQRIDLYVPCRILCEGKEYDAEVRDLSINGCRVSAPVAVTNNEMVELTFTLPDGIPIETMRALVRNAHPTDAGSFFGCEFLDGQEHIQSDLAFYVAATLERTSADHRAAPRLLIVERDQDRIAPLRQAFVDKGWHVFATPSSIEALLRLRMMPPTAVLVNHDQSDVAGVQFMDLLKAARWVEAIPVYIYGPDGRTLPNGAAGYFAADMSAPEVCDAISAEVRPSEPPSDPPPAGEDNSIEMKDEG